ncbi:hypothetical protein D3C78_1514630 [compost metagenome]
MKELNKSTPNNCAATPLWAANNTQPWAMMNDGVTSSNQTDTSSHLAVGKCQRERIIASPAPSNVPMIAVLIDKTSEL